jgi:hypothetical protein
MTGSEEDEREEESWGKRPGVPEDGASLSVCLFSLRKQSALVIWQKAPLAGRGVQDPLLIGEFLS